MFPLLPALWKILQPHGQFSCSGKRRTGQGWNKLQPLFLFSPVGCFQTHFQDGDHSNSLVITFQWIRAEARHWCCGLYCSYKAIAEHGLDSQSQACIQGKNLGFKSVYCFLNPTLDRACRKSDLIPHTHNSFIHLFIHFPSSFTGRDHGSNRSRGSARTSQITATNYSTLWAIHRLS